MSNEVVYRYTGRGFRRGVPRRDLTARDVARMPPSLLKDVTGGPEPMYVPARKAPKAAPAEAAAAPAKAGKE